MELSRGLRPVTLRLRYRASRELGRRRAALARAFATVRRETWARRERDLRYVTDAGQNWTIA